MFARKASHVKTVPKTMKTIQPRKQETKAILMNASMPGYSFQPRKQKVTIDNGILEAKHASRWDLYVGGSFQSIRGLHTATHLARPNTNEDPLVEKIRNAMKPMIEGLATKKQLEGLATKKQLEGLNEKFNGLNRKVDGLNRKVVGLNHKVGSIYEKIAREGIAAEYGTDFTSPLTLASVHDVVQHFINCRLVQAASMAELAQLEGKITSKLASDNNVFVSLAARLEKAGPDAAGKKKKLADFRTRYTTANEMADALVQKEWGDIFMMALIHAAESERASKNKAKKEQMSHQLIPLLQQSAVRITSPPRELEVDIKGRATLRANVLSIDCGEAKSNGGGAERAKEQLRMRILALEYAATALFPSPPAYVLRHGVIVRPRQDKSPEVVIVPDISTEATEEEKEQQLLDKALQLKEMLLEGGIRADVVSREKKFPSWQMKRGEPVRLELKKDGQLTALVRSGGTRLISIACLIPDMKELLDEVRYDTAKDTSCEEVLLQPWDVDEEHDDISYTTHYV